MEGTHLQGGMEARQPSVSWRHSTTKISPALGPHGEGALQGAGQERMASKAKEREGHNSNPLGW